MAPQAGSMAQVGAANGSLLLLASLLAGWVKVPGDIPRDFVTSPSLLCQDLCRMEATSQGSHTPQLPALSGPKRPLVVGEVGACSVQRVTKGQQALYCCYSVLAAPGSDALQGPSVP